MIYRTMNDGNKIPALGFGTYQMTSAEVYEHLGEAIELGIRHIDTANRYFNEVAVGDVIRRCGVPRGELFVTSKLFPQDYPYEKCGAAIDATLERLGLDYLDLLLFHQPYGEYLAGWPAMEEAVRAGKVRSIGIDNFSTEQVREILDIATIKPAAIQIEMNPRNNRHAFKAELADAELTYEGWYPLGHGDKALLEESVFVEAAEKYSKTPAQVILRWHLQEGNVVFPKTLSPQHMAQNLDIFDFELNDAEMERIGALPQCPYHRVSKTSPAWMSEVADYSQQL